MVFGDSVIGGRLSAVVGKPPPGVWRRRVGALTMRAVRIPVKRVRGGAILMLRRLGFILAVGLTAGGALWLLFQTIVVEQVSGRLVAAAFIVLAMGVYWLWIDYIHPLPGQDE